MNEQIFRALKTVREMLDDRGYVVEDDPRLESFEAFEESLEEEEVWDQCDICAHDAEGNPIRVYWQSGNLGAGPVKLLKSKIDTDYEDVKDGDVKRCIVIMECAVTPDAQTAIKQLKYSNCINIEVFTLREMLINVSKHVLVPKHIICSTEEEKELLTSYSVTKEQIPEIKVWDPQARYLGAQTGQIIKIYRKSTTMPGQICLTYSVVTS